MKTIIENADGTLIIDNVVYKPVKDNAPAVAASTKQAVFANLMKGLRPKHDRKHYPHSTFWFKDNTWLFEHDEHEKYFWCSHKQVWSVFEQEFNMDYVEIEAFLRTSLEQYFKRRGAKANFASHKYEAQIEAHFAGVE